MRKYPESARRFALYFLTAMAFPVLCVAQKPVKVFILAGQSNMVGHGEVYANANRRAVGSLEYEVDHDTSGSFRGIAWGTNNWKVRKDVWVRFDRGESGLKKGDLTIGYGATDKEIGPELQFGNVMGDYFADQVLLIKTAWGGKSLGVDFRPPSSGGTTGIFYRKMIDEVHAALNNLAAEFPGYRGQGYQLAGFVWNQGWNDAGDSSLYKEYRSNMVHLIKDVRHDLGETDLPFVIVTCGQGGFESTRDKWMTRVQTIVAKAQADAAASPEFSGNVALVDSKPFWKDSLQSPATEVHHYNRNAGTYFLMGDAAGHAMIALLKRRAAAQSSTPDRDGKDPAKEVTSGGLKGYISFRTTPQPAGYSSGIGFYSAVYSMLPKAIANFQIGLASTWITPDNSDNHDQPLCPIGSYARDNWEKGRGPTFKDVFQTIEGGLGIWGSTQFRSGYTSPKFQIVGVPDCYSGNYLISPGWGNSPVATADDKMGVAQLSNRLLVPPDGITFKGHPNGELFGYSWMALPFSDVKREMPPTGNQYWTLFFALSNFKGPVAFIVPESWSKISANYTFDQNRGLDSRGGRSGGGAQEINTVPYFEMKGSGGATYSRVPEFLYPVDQNNETILIQDVRYYSEKALASAVENWRKGGPACQGAFLTSDGASVLGKLKASPLNFRQADQNITLTGFDQVVQTCVFGDSTAFGLKWKESTVSPRGVLPQYFREVDGIRVAVSASDAPAGLTKKTFAPARDGKPYTSPVSGAWATPGPARGPYYATLADGSRVTYYWYRFIDQPSLQQYRRVWGDSVLSAMQALVEQIHKNWTPDKTYMPAPKNGHPLVPIDPALLVTPPPGLEAGYVPIVTRQEAATGIIRAAAQSPQSGRDAPQTNATDKRIKDYGLKDYTYVSKDLPHAEDKPWKLVCQMPYNCQFQPWIRVKGNAGRSIALNSSNPLVLYLTKTERVITKPGVSTYEAKNWISGEGSIYTIPAGVTVQAVKYHETGYNTTFSGSFECDDEAYNILWKKAARTGYLCMRDHFYDCPDRERVGFWGDGTPELDQCFYAFDTSSYALCKDLVLRPPDPKFYPGQQLEFLGEYGLWFYYMHTGDTQSLGAVYESTKNFLFNVYKPGKKNQWFDWGKEIKDIAVIETCFMYIDLKTLRKIALLTGHGEDTVSIDHRLDSISGSFDRLYWKNGCYLSSQVASPDDRANAMAVNAGLAEPSKWKDIYDNVLTRVTNSSCFFDRWVFEALCRMGKQDYALLRMYDRYKTMIPCTFSTLWEHYDRWWATKKNAFDDASSLNHGWNPPVILLSQRIAGISPEEPGWKVFHVLPKEAFLRSIKVVVPTIHGNIETRMNKTDSVYSLTVVSPEGTSAIVGIPKRAFSTLELIRLNGKIIWDGGFQAGVKRVSAAGEDTDYIRFLVPAGTWSFLGVGSVILRASRPTDEASPKELRLNRKTWTATASVKDSLFLFSGDRIPVDVSAANAIDGDHWTGWRDMTGKQYPGQWFMLDMKRQEKFDKIELDNTWALWDSPVHYVVNVSRDAKHWGNAVAEGAGHLGITEISFPVQEARFIKITQTGTDPTYNWSIYEMGVYRKKKPFKLK